VVLLLCRIYRRCVAFPRQWTSAGRLLIVWAIVISFSFPLEVEAADYISAPSSRSAHSSRGVGALARTTAPSGAVALGVVCIAGAAVLLTATSRVGSLLKLPSENHAAITAVLTRLAVALLLCTIVVAAAWWRRDARACVAVFIGVPVVFITVGFGGIRLYAASKSARALADAIPALPPTPRSLVCDVSRPGLPFWKNW
jgi:hypothetical protein